MFEMIPELHDDAIISETEYRGLQGALNGGVWRPAAHTTTTGVGSIEFTNIPQTGSMLGILYALDGDRAGQVFDNIFLSVNDAAPGGASGDTNVVYGQGTTVVSDELPQLGSGIYLGSIGGASSSAGAHGGGFFTCHGYTLPGYKTWVGTTSYWSGTNSTAQVHQITGTLEVKTPITSIKLDQQFGPNFVAGGAVTLLIAGGTRQGVDVAAPDNF